MSTEPLKLNEKLGSMNIHIKARPGVYVFNQDSANGKTYLYQIIRNNAQLLRNKIVAYSCVDKDNGFRIDDLFVDNKPYILLLDRYDMMQGEFLEIIKRMGDSGIVLVDTKKKIVGSGKAGIRTKFIPIKYTKDGIEVIQNDLYI